MQSHRGSFPFGIDFNFFTDSVLQNQFDSNNNFPPVVEPFLLLDGEDFLLLDGSLFLLLG